MGLSIGFWNDKAVGGQKVRLAVVLINDLDQPWNGPVTLWMKCGGREVLKLSQTGQLGALGKATLDFDFTWPNWPAPAHWKRNCMVWMGNLSAARASFRSCGLHPKAPRT